MISAGQTTNSNNSCFSNVSSSQGLQIYGTLINGREDHIVAAGSSMEISSHSSSLVYNLSLLKDKVNQVQSLVSILAAGQTTPEPESTSLAIARIGTMVQEIIITASSMVFTCQQMANLHNTDHQALHHNQAPHKVQENGLLLQSTDLGGNNNNIEQEQDRDQQSYFSSEAFEWYADNNYNDNNSNNNNRDLAISCSNNKIEKIEYSYQNNQENAENIIELAAADLLAKYNYYCQVCGKGFKRDANLRMHMRAHGDEYKTNAALSNPMKKKKNSNSSSKDHGEDSDNNNNRKKLLPRKYSCPQEGCRWNKKHEKFQPLKSMICVKNHYKRSHCPKMYVCKRCNRKQFSVLSDLRTHEKHCGDLKWQCSCGTTFSRKDKLMGHVALFIGHTPAINNNNDSSFTKHAAAAKKVKNQAI